jgi:hypothetical protein
MALLADEGLGGAQVEHPNILRLGFEAALKLLDPQHRALTQPRDQPRQEGHRGDQC